MSQHPRTLWCRWCGAMVVPEVDHGDGRTTGFTLKTWASQVARVSAVSNSPSIVTGMRLTKMKSETDAGESTMFLTP